MKGYLDIGTSNKLDPSATAHRKAVGAVHTYAVEELEGEQDIDSNGRRSQDGQPISAGHQGDFEPPFNEGHSTVEGHVLGYRTHFSSMHSHSRPNCRSCRAIQPSHGPHAPPTKYYSTSRAHAASLFPSLTSF